MWPPGVVSPTAAQFAARIPLRRVGQPADVAAVIAFLASAEAAHVTGVGWLIDGGTNASKLGQRAGQSSVTDK